MFTTFQKNRKIGSLLCVLFVMVGSHFILASIYVNSYDYAANHYHDADWTYYAYEMTLFAILGELGLVSCSSSILKVLFSLLLIPNVLFVSFMLAAFSVNQGATFISLANYHDYLSLLPFLVDGLLLVIGMHIIGLFFNRASL